MPKTIHTLTLLNRALTLVTGLAISKIELPRGAVLTDPHDIHITVLQLTHVSQLLDTIPLSVNCKVAVAAAATPTPTGI